MDLLLVGKCAIRLFVICTFGDKAFISFIISNNQRGECNETFLALLHPFLLALPSIDWSSDHTDVSFTASSSRFLYSLTN